MKFEPTVHETGAVLEYYQTRTRLDRAIVMFQNKTEVREVAPDVWLVSSQTNGEKYLVDVRAETCTCKDFLHRCCVTGIPCKHVQLVKLEKTKRGTVQVSNLPPWESIY